MTIHMSTNRHHLFNLLLSITAGSMAVGGCAVDIADDDAQMSADEAAVQGAVQSSPEDGATRVAPNAQIVLTFKTPYQPAFATIEQVRLIPIGDENWAERVVLVHDSSHRKLIIKPTRPLQGRYLVEIKGVRTEGGVVDHRFTFTAMRNALVSFDGYLFDPTDPADFYTVRNQLDAAGRIARSENAFGDGFAYTEFFSYDRTNDAPLKTVTSEAGPDGINGTADDVLSSRVQVASFDTLGFTTKNVAKDVGPDGVLGTADDTVSSYSTFTRVPGANVVSIFFGAGPDGVWFTGDDETGQVQREALDSAGRLYRVSVINEPGPDGLWRTSDDPIDSFQEHTYTATTVTRRLVQLGNDHVEGTADDTETRHVDTLDANGFVTRTVGLLSGDDGLFATPDDYIFQDDLLPSPFAPIRRLVGSGQGPDGLWNTADDEIYSYFVETRDATGALETIGLFGDPGADGVWFTADDRRDNFEVYRTGL
jgi:hypothetical protein